MSFACRASLVFALGVLPAVGQRASEWRSFRTADGLAGSISTSLTFSQRGDVLVKHPNTDKISVFDGYVFRTLPSPRPGIQRIYETRTGQIWVAAPEGLQEFRDGAWVLHRIPEVAAESQTNQTRTPAQLPILPLRQDRVLVLLANRLLEYTASPQPQTAVLLTAEKLGLGRLIDLVFASDGGLWITAGEGIARLPASEAPPRADSVWQVFRPGPELQIHEFRVPVPDGGEGVTLVCESSATPGRVIAFFDGKIWTAVNTGNNRLRFAWRSGSAFHAIAANSAIRFDTSRPGVPLEEEDTVAGSFLDLAAEPGGAVWLASVDGIHRYAPLPWQIPPGLDQSRQSVLAIHEDPAGRVLFLCSQSVLVLDGRSWRRTALPENLEGGLQSPVVSVLAADGSLLFESEDVLFRFDPRTEAVTPITTASEMKMRLLGKHSSGAALFAGERTGETGLHVLVANEFQPANLPAPPPEIGPLLWSRIGPTGRLLLAGTNGLAWLDGPQWQILPSRSSDGPGEVTSAYEQADGRWWFGSPQGAWEFDGRKWLRVRGGLNRVNALLRARDGSVWCATRTGMQRLLHDDWFGLGTEEGLPAEEVTDVFEDSQGRVWAGTSRGPALYHPGTDTDPPRTTILNIQDATVPASDPTITLRFRGRDRWRFTTPSRLLFSWGLDGREWSAFKADTSVSFSDLKAGKHYFQVRAMDRNGNVELKPAQLEFSVAVPWYQEGRLVVIACLGLAGALSFATLAWNRHRRLVRSHAEIERIVDLRTQQLQRAHEELLHSEKMKSLGTLAAGIAHDFNNILSIIKGSVQIIEGNLENRDKVLTRTGRINTVVQQGAEIVQAMLGFSRLPEQPVAQCDVNEVAADTIKLLGDHFLRRMTIEFRPANGLPSVTASKHFLQQILLNFIFNAADATEGQGRITLLTGRVEKPASPLALAPAEGDGYVFLGVQDFGCGIAPEVLPRIFEPFFTTKGFSARRGTGLGLSMVYELAQKMGCGLKVESAVGGGSTFTVLVPIRALPAGPGLDPAREPGLTTGSQPKNPNPKPE